MEGSMSNRFVAINNSNLILIYISYENNTTFEQIESDLE